MRLTRLIALAATTGVLTLLGTGVAAAHITATADTTQAGSTSVVTLSVLHGCKGSSTTRLAIKIPPSIDSVTPTVNQGWTVKKIMQKLRAPITDDEGNTITHRVDQVVFTARTPLPDGYRDTFALSLQLAADGAGKNLSFPTIQTCLRGETAWLQIPRVGQDPEELESPAPTILITAAEPDEAVAPPAAAPTPADRSETAPTQLLTEVSPARSSGSAVGLAIAGLVAGFVGLAAAWAALARKSKQT